MFYKVTVFFPVITGLSLPKCYDVLLEKRVLLQKRQERSWEVKEASPENTLFSWPDIFLYVMVLGKSTMPSTLLSPNIRA